jgi:NSS family neurotransmitter:Na+ symporter
MFLNKILIYYKILFHAVIGAAFFFLLFAAALTSAVSLLEVAFAYFMRKFSRGRKQAVLIIGSIIFVLGIPSRGSTDYDYG